MSSHSPSAATLIFPGLSIGRDERGIKIDPDASPQLVSSSASLVAEPENFELENDEDCDELPNVHTGNTTASTIPQPQSKPAKSPTKVIKPEKKRPVKKYKPSQKKNRQLSEDSLHFLQSYGDRWEPDTL
ncbi:hypothetical protein TrLO_g5447 [Triparma laevis f. longispina]|uniref:Uncharacterized protein n=1 Tax=Triparma laevis f. longispina TaxID=1714387 RepID=A0A9W6ZRY2_9STRA|nr:hypothetical protein TrLO_g5447 [Triparma laevis f. longispina]